MKLRKISARKSKTEARTHSGCFNNGNTDCLHLVCGNHTSCVNARLIVAKHCESGFVRSEPCTSTRLSRVLARSEA
jgi:hypothetical protein